MREKYLTASFKELCEMTAGNRPAGNLHTCLQVLEKQILGTEIANEIKDSLHKLCEMTAGQR